MSNIIKLDYENYQISFNNDGWINATEAAKKFGKIPNEWLRLPDTANYINALSSRYGKIPYVKTSKARYDRGGGTWIHPKLAVKFARWLSIDFEIWCDEVIDNLYKSKTIIYTNEQIVKLLTLNEADTWEKRFMDGFYKALARVTNTRYLGHNQGTPFIFARITKEWVYEVAIPSFVYKAARSKCKKGEKIHQYLTPTALKAVEMQLISITSLANGCLDYQDFISRCSQAYEKQGQIKMILPKSA